MKEAVKVTDDHKQWTNTDLKLNTREFLPRRNLETKCEVKHNI
jgi:hypothetical protein